MNHPGQPGNNHGPGQTLIQGGPPPSQPQYVAASPPGVAVSLPGSSAPQHMHPAYPGNTTPGHGMAAATPVAAPGQAHAPVPPQAQAAPSGRAPANHANDEQLMKGVGKTVYEFQGAHSEEARSGGKHKTFFADGAELSALAVKEERQRSNLDSGGPMWLIGVLVVAVVGGLLAFFLMADSGSGDDDAQAQADEVEAAVAAPEPAAPAEDAATTEGAPAAAAATEGAPAEATPAEPEATPPAPAEPEATPPAPTDEPEPAPEPEPAKKKSSSTTKKKSSSTTKKKSSETKKVPSISPSRPPRSGLDNLPAPD